MRRFVFMVLMLAGLAACVTQPAPVRSPVSPPIPADTPPADAPGPVQGSFVPDLSLTVCPIRVRNAPPSDTNRRIGSYSQLFIIDQRLALATVPVNGACLSSGFGLRDGRLHKGLDLSAPRGSPVYAAAPGIVREIEHRGALGRFIVIDHGGGIYTRYAHLDGFAAGLRVGDRLGFGWQIGAVGNSSTQRIGVHLHYEVLTGNYNTPRGSFGLTAHDPFSFPVYRPRAES